MYRQNPASIGSQDFQILFEPAYASHGIPTLRFLALGPKDVNANEQIDTLTRSTMARQYAARAATIISSTLLTPN